MKEEVDLSAPSDEAIQLKRIADALEKLVNHLTGKVTYTYDNKFFLTKGDSMRIKCGGVYHSDQTGELMCPRGETLDEDSGQTWEVRCADCRDELDRWDELYAQARRDTEISADLKDRP